MISRRANKNLAILAFMACIGLGYALVLELMTPPAGQARAAAQGSDHKSAFNRKIKKPFDASVPIARFQETLTRPLFRESRRPVEPETHEKGAAPTALTVKLIGVVISAERRTALIREQNVTQIMEIEVGQMLQGWILERILPDRIILKSGTTYETYHLETEPEKVAPRVRTPRRNTRRKVAPAKPRR